MSPALRARLPALAVAGLLNALFAWLLVDALSVGRPTKQSQTASSETTITLSPLPAILPPKKRLRRPAGGSSSTAITVPYFNPYTYQGVRAPAEIDAIVVALSACDPGRYDMASADVRQVCDRIGLALKNDPGHFGVTQDVADPKHWQRELARREAPHLLPCMKAHAPKADGMGTIFKIDLQTLLCVYQIVFVEYDSKNHEHYSQ